MNTVREEVGSFMVKTEAGEINKVIVSQEVVILYGKEHIFTGKYMNFDSINGPNVAWTDKDNVFRLEDGTELRKRV